MRDLLVHMNSNYNKLNVEDDLSLWIDKRARILLSAYHNFRVIEYDRMEWAVRILDYLHMRSDTVSKFNDAELIRLLGAINDVLDCIDNENSILYDIPDIFIMLSEIITFPPTVYDYTAVFSDMLTYRNFRIINFLHLVAIYSGIVHKYPTGIIALASVYLSEKTNTVFYLLDEYFSENKQLFVLCINDLINSIQHPYSKYYEKMMLQHNDMQILSGDITLMELEIQYGPHYSSQKESLKINHPQIIEPDLTPGVQLGMGSGGVVKLLNGEYASKNFFKGKSLLEFVMINNLVHINIGTLLGLIPNDTKTLIYEAGYADLDSLVYNTPHKVTKEKIRNIMLQLIRGIDYCHNNFVAHLDIKPSNIILYEEDIIKLIDFGSSQKFNPYLIQLNNQCTTRIYCPPENLRMKGNLCNFKAVDMWSAGMIMLFLLSKGKYPKILYDDPSILKHITHLIKNVTLKNLDLNMTDLEESFLSELLEFNPKVRISANNALLHPYLN